MTSNPTKPHTQTYYPQRVSLKQRATSKITRNFTSERITLKVRAEEKVRVEMQLLNGIKKGIERKREVNEANVSRALQSRPIGYDKSKANITAKELMSAFTEPLDLLARSGFRQMDEIVKGAVLLRGDITNDIAKKLLPMLSHEFANRIYNSMVKTDDRASVTKAESVEKAFGNYKDGKAATLYRDYRLEFTKSARLKLERGLLEDDRIEYQRMAELLPRLKRDPYRPIDGSPARGLTPNYKKPVDIDGSDKIYHAGANRMDLRAYYIITQTKTKNGVVHNIIIIDFEKHNKNST